MQPSVVSVIVPVYNVIDYLQKCVDSLLAQTLQEIQIILVDDASTDGSSALCDAIASQDTRVVVVHQSENQGVSAARNRGIDVATGAFLFFSDADDTLDPEGLAFLVGLLCKNKGCDLAACGYYTNGVPSNEPQQTPVVWAQDTALKAIFDYRFSVVKGTLWNKLFRRAVVIQHKIRFDEDAYICEDSLFCLRYLLVSGHMVYHNMPQYRYIHRTGSAMHSRLTLRRLSVLPTYQKMMELCVHQDPSLRNMLKINYLNHQLHLLQVTWKIKDAETMQAAGAIYRTFRPDCIWFLCQKNVRLKRKLIALFFCFTAFRFPKG